MIDNDVRVDWKKYLLVFFITLSLFLTATVLSNSVGRKKFSELEQIQNDIALNILASETQFSLLEETRCEDVTNSILSDELNVLAGKLEEGSASIGGTNADTEYIRNYYFLLEIKDYLLMQKAQERCKLDVTPIVYFYGKSDECPDCEKQSIALTEVRSRGENARVYSFDYDSNISAVKTFIAINKVPRTLPAIVVNGKVYAGYQSLEELKKIAPHLIKEAVEEKTTVKTTKTVPVKK